MSEEIFPKERVFLDGRSGCWMSLQTRSGVIDVEVYCRVGLSLRWVVALITTTVATLAAVGNTTVRHWIVRGVSSTFDLGVPLK
jgi:hypothetical protein